MGDLPLNFANVHLENGIVLKGEMQRSGEYRNYWIDSDGILHIDSLGARTDIFETISKFVHGLGWTDVRILASSIDLTSSTAYVR